MAEKIRFAAAEAGILETMPSSSASLIVLLSKASSRSFISSAFDLRRSASPVKASPEPPESAWQDISTAPKDGRHILLWWGEEIILSAFLDNSGTSHPWKGFRPVGSMIATHGKATHWQQLPKGPEE